MNTTQNKNILITIVVAVIVGFVAFYGGIQYQKNQRANFAGSFAGRIGGQNTFLGRQGVRPIMGEIIGQDDSSITVKMQDGSTKIVILSDKTLINKASTGTKSDLKKGERISAFGSENSDGSITAQNISIGETMFRNFRGTSQQETPQPTGN